MAAVRQVPTEATPLKGKKQKAKRKPPRQIYEVRGTMGPYGSTWPMQFWRRLPMTIRKMGGGRCDKCSYPIGKGEQYFFLEDDSESFCLGCADFYIVESTDADTPQAK